MRLARPIAAAALVGMLALSGLLLRWLEPADPPSPEVAGQPLPQHAPAAVAPNRTETPAAPAPASASAPGDVAARLRAEFWGATDYRSFVLSAMQRPAEGGYFYAKHVALACATRPTSAFVEDGIRKSVADRGTLPPAQLRAGDRMLAQCATFAPGEARQLFLEIGSRLADGRDPLVEADRLVTDAASSGDPASLRTAVTRLLEVADPMLLTETGALMVVARSDAQARAQDGLWLEGVLVTRDDEAAYWLSSTAIAIGSCPATGRCALDEWLQSSCIASGDCQGDLQGYFRSAMQDGGMSAGDIDRVFARAARVRRAIAEKDVSFFVR